MGGYYRRKMYSVARIFAKMQQKQLIYIYIILKLSVCRKICLLHPEV